jgi:hypothetical protein
VEVAESDKHSSLLHYEFNEHVGAEVVENKCLKTKEFSFSLKIIKKEKYL